ncbi:NAD(P)/FAD-dependent oxidoreductase [Tunturibacter empetritectus]|uniref:Flavin-dependent dehydrogenase n=1 Tax=Tunturiibacter empetritectus TaxID=3069691 RepID=A0A7W8MQN3_9BACT|nr:FAD-dependent monooxygenase [Edaphobacter lichenicola]MBB5316901.1 flavin-dependent dehydrogenase [Edaphobacter lichenicola]
MNLRNGRSAAEVLIVGAGPAGLAAAIASATNGLHVEVIDSRQPPIDKACGEGLMPDALHALANLGFNLNRDLHNTENYLLSGIRFLNDHPERNPTTAEAIFPENPGRGIRRTVLHQLLLDRALSLGVRCHWDNSVQSIEPAPTGHHVHTNRQIIRTRYLIGADGHHSRIAAWAGLTAATVHSRRIGLRQHYAIAPWTNFVEVYWSNHGQAYVTPTSSNEVCVAFISNKKIPSPDLALTHFPTLQRHLAAATPSSAPRGSITLGRSLRRVTANNIALLGDSSGSVDAVTGEGLALCFRQASALARALNADDLPSYQHAHSRIQLAPSLMSRSLLQMDRSPRLRARVLNTFERYPILFQRLLEVHIDHRACIFPGIDELLATGLHLLTS